jgi:hypothetical protein
MEPSPSDKPVPQKRPTITMNKKRHKEICDTLREILDDPETLDKVLECVCKVMNYNPNEPYVTYNDKQAQYIRSYHERQKEKGISTYISGGRRKQYETMKQKNQCSNYLCESTGFEKYKVFCIRCFVHLHPDNTIVKRYKTKESLVVECVKNAFPNETMVFDKKVEGGCSRYRPDIFLDCLTHSIVIEVDENQHNSYDCSCENKRMMAIFQDLGQRPLVFIRFNPDDYIDDQGKNVKSCFKYMSKIGLPSVNKEKEWKARLDVLICRIEHHVSNVPQQELTVEHLYYDVFV